MHYILEEIMDSLGVVNNTRNIKWEETKYNMVVFIKKKQKEIKTIKWSRYYKKYIVKLLKTGEAFINT